MLTNYSSNSSIIQGLTTPELNSDLELPNLFYPELGSSTAISSGSNSNWDPLDLNLANLQALLDSSIPSNGNLYTSSGSTSASTGAISPQLTRLDSPKLENLILPNFNLITTSQVLPTPSLPLPIVKKGGRKRKEILIESESEDLESTIVESLEIEAIKPLVFARDKFNGSRNTKIKPIDFNAPTMSRSYVIPSITSRKRAPPAISAKLLPTLINKRVKRDLTPSSATAFDEFNDEGVDPSELPDELLSAIELKRRQNVSFLSFFSFLPPLLWLTSLSPLFLPIQTLAARRSRMRKAAHLDDVKKAEDEARKQVEATKKELNEWKRRALVAEAELKLLKGF